MKKHTKQPPVIDTRDTLLTPQRAKMHLASDRLSKKQVKLDQTVELWKDTNVGGVLEAIGTLKEGEFPQWVKTPQDFVAFRQLAVMVCDKLTFA